VGGRSLSSPSKVTRQFGTSTTLRNWAGEAEPLRGVPGGTRMTKTADLGRCCRRRNGPVRFSAGWLPGRCPARVSHPFRRLVASVGEAHVPWANSSTGGRNQAWTISAHHANQRRPLLRLFHRRHLSLCFLGSSFPDCGEQRQARSEGSGGLADQRNRRRTPTQSLVPPSSVRTNGGGWPHGPVSRHGGTKRIWLPTCALPSSVGPAPARSRSRRRVQIGKFAAPPPGCPKTCQRGMAKSGGMPPCNISYGLPLIFGRCCTLLQPAQARRMLLWYHSRTSCKDG
jgi:hypothetical protein